jgi:SAM-dependent methyltransferase
MADPSPDAADPARPASCPAADAALDLYAAERLSPAMAAMQVVLATPDEAALSAALARAGTRHGSAVFAPLVERLDGAAQARVREVASALDHSFTDADPLAVLQRLAAGFDRAAAVSPEAGVALYSLGDPALLQETTAEVVDWLRAEGLARPGEALLEVGCGSGRFLAALAGQARLAIGVEISAAMAAEAASRLWSHRRVIVVRGSGVGLPFVRAGAIDLVLFADSFPYVVQAGGELPLRTVAEAARVLAPGGRAVMLNWSYRGDPARDRQDAESLAARCGLRLRPVAPPRFRTWDASATVLDRG